MGIRFVHTDSIRFLIWEELASLGIKHCFTIAPEDFGIKTEKDRSLLQQRYEEARKQAGCLSKRIFFPQQVHGNKVHPIRQGEEGIASVAGEYIPNCDALITDVPGYTLISQYADCTPISIVDGRQKVISCVHAGWRGTKGRILLRSLNMMMEEYGSCPADLQLFVWPGIRQPSFEVDEDVAKVFMEEFSEYPTEHFLYGKGEKFHIDLVFLNVEIAKRAGIPQKNIHLSGICTFADPRFHSYRRDKDSSGRMALLMEI